ncbi:ATP-binding protein [Epilithonimonas lactis]|uniref:ATPase n=1 Tax=Epilithonimonas lactis TaxID=421072 RepID=A0A085BLB3_9FLAO|nr:ATP-binding protein [Epilithonimonas lactis]KFC23258.1 ATPase [Epilithonimonas lactis]SEQ07050.1 ATP-dependent DNA helicase RecG [Epilithonimonas lactis]
MNTPISKINTIVTLEYLQTQRENQYFERKGLGEKDIKPAKIAEELIGMLNADGGILVFGVADNGAIEDLNTLGDKIDSYRKLAFDFIKPPCNIQLEEIEIDDKLIFLFHVEQDLERVFCQKDSDNVYLRVLDTNRLLDRDRIKKLEYDKSIRRFEEESSKNFDIDDFDQELLEEYRQKLNYKGDAYDLLTKRHLTQKKEDVHLFKNAAVLLFANDPEKYIPSASMRYIRYEGITALTGSSHNVIKDERFENNIPRLLEEIKLFLKASFKDYYFLDIDTGRFVKVPEYPEEAWLEGIVNALCHRSYNVQGNAIYIKHFDDRLEISNSGPLPAQVTIENIKSERFARNPRIARVLEDLGYVRQLNEGVSRIYESMEKSMLSVPEYSEKNGNVYLVLRNRISRHSKTIHDTVMEKIEKDWKKYNETQRRILLFLFIRHTATLGEIVDYININENTVRTYLNKMIDDGMLDRLSEKQRDKNAVYRFKKQ